MDTAGDPTAASEYQFTELSRGVRPTGVQYTPEYDPNWLYPTGAKAGGTRDDVPVQGLELGVLAHGSELVEVVEATLRALESYYQRFGYYPRHRVVADFESFREHATGRTGLVATVQARSPTHDGLTGHFRATQATADPDPLVAPNYEPTLRLAVRVVASLTACGPRFARTDRQPQDERFQQIADTRVFERYAPLGASGLYDPAGGIDFESPDAEAVAGLSFTPASLALDDRRLVETAAWFVTRADDLLGVVDRG